MKAILMMVLKTKVSYLCCGQHDSTKNCNNPAIATAVPKVAPPTAECGQYIGYKTMDGCGINPVPPTAYARPGNLSLKQPEEKREKSQTHGLK